MHSQPLLNWEPTNRPFGQRYVSVERIVEDKKGYLFAATGDGLWRSTDQGRIWKRYIKKLGPEATNVDVDSTGRLYVSEWAGHMFYSDDEGVNLSTIPLPKVGYSIVRATGSGVLLAYAPEIFDTTRISTDLGKTWTPIPVAGDVFSEVMPWWGDTIVKFSDYQASYYLSGDFGKTWTNWFVDSVQPVAYVQRINDSDVYAYRPTSGYFDGPYYLSHDRGAHFSQIAEPGAGVSFFFAGPGSGTYITGKPYNSWGPNEDTVLITHDDGKHWQPIPQLLSHAPGYRSGIFTREGTILIGSDDTSFVSYDSGRSWQNSNTIFSYSTKFVSHGQELWTSAYSDSLDVTTDNGDTWKSIVTPILVYNFFITSSGAIVIEGGDADPHVSTDGGASWRDIFQGSPVGLFVIGDTIIIATDSTLLVSSTFGAGWDTLALADTLDGHPTASFLITPRGAIWMFVQDSFYLQGAMRISTDFGKTFGIPRPASIGQSYFDSNGTVYVFQNFQFLRSMNDGVLWDTIPTPWSRYVNVTDMGQDGQRLFVSSDSGLYSTTNDGKDWIIEDMGIQDRIIGCIGSHDNYLFLGTDGGAYRAKDSLLTGGGSLLTAVSSIPHAPKDTSIHWAGVRTETQHRNNQPESFPNPFSKTTMISFTPVTSGYAEISIFNLLGAEVARIFSGELEAGKHTYTWNPEGLPDGMYECIVRMKGQMEKLPVVLLR